MWRRVIKWIKAVALRRKRISSSDLPYEVSSPMLAVLLATKGVISVDRFRAIEHAQFVIVEAQISVDPKISVSEGQEIARIAKLNLMRKFDTVTDVFVSIQPYDSAYPYKAHHEAGTDDWVNTLH